MQEGTTLEDVREKKPSPFPSETEPPSESTADQRFPVSFGLVVSCRLGDVQGIRESVQRLGGRIIYQTVSEGQLFLFREAQVERALNGDVSALIELHRRKSKGSAVSQ